MCPQHIKYPAFWGETHHNHRDGAGVCLFVCKISMEQGAKGNRGGSAKVQVCFKIPFLTLKHTRLNTSLKQHTIQVTGNLLIPHKAEQSGKHGLES